MQRLTLQSLRLTHFKGCKEFTLSPNGGTIRVHGANASGKTTLADAYLWALTGKDSSGRQDFEIKPIVLTGLPGLEQHTSVQRTDSSVSITFDLDGESLDLERTLREKWQTTRGEEGEKFAGNETLFRINSVAVPMNQYQSRVNQLAPEKRMRMLSDPTYFATTLPWAERRSMLLEVCGDATLDEIVASDPALADLPAILGRHTPEDFKKIAEERRKASKKAGEEVTPRIDELQRSLPETVGSRSQLENLIAAARAEHDALAEKIATITAGGQAAQTSIALAECEASILAERNRLAEKVAEATSFIRYQVDQTEERVKITSQSLQKARDEVDRLNRLAERLAGENESLLARYNKINGEEFADTIDATCPSCGQDLPAARVAEVRATALAKFNDDKASRLAPIVEAGKRLRADITDTAEKLVAATAAITSLEEADHRAKEELAAVNAELTAASGAEVPVQTSDVLTELRAKKDALQQELAQAKLGTQGDLEKHQEARRQLEAKIEGHLGAIAIIDRAEATKKRIEELRAEAKKHAATQSEADHHLYLLELYTRARVKFLTDRINSFFDVTQFRLFEQQVNGGITEVCEATFDGVPYKDLNTGMKLNVGLDIIDTLAKHFGFAPPIFIDNAESVTAIRPTIGQQIQLIVSADDKVLRTA